MNNSLTTTWYDSPCHKYWQLMYSETCEVRPHYETFCALKWQVVFDQRYKCIRIADFRMVSCHRSVSDCSGLTLQVSLNMSSKIKIILLSPHITQTSCDYYSTLMIFKIKRLWERSCTSIWNGPSFSIIFSVLVEYSILIIIHNVHKW